MQKYNEKAQKNAPTGVGAKDVSIAIASCFLVLLIAMFFWARSSIFSTKEQSTPKVFARQSSLTSSATGSVT